MTKVRSDPSAALIGSWDQNAVLWTRAVREQGIPSRSAATDGAIVNFAMRLKPARVLDVGCGEGWLVRRLVDELGCTAVGIDGSARLIAAARDRDGRGRYLEVTYAALIEKPDRIGGPYDLAICNFALLDQEVASLLAALRQVLDRTGTIVIQTLHPWAANAEQGYVDGWREETFAAFEGGDWEAMPWYFRTLGSWFAEIDAAGLCVTSCEEPRDPATGNPLSLIFGCRPS